MANFIYDKAKEAVWSGNVNWTGNTIKFVFCTSGYVANQSTDDFLDDILVGNRVATSTALTGKTNSAGTLDATDHTVTSVSGSQVTQIVLYVDSGVESTSQLLCKIDTGTNLPFTPNGSDVTVQWNASGIIQW